MWTGAADGQSRTITFALCLKRRCRSCDSYSPSLQCLQKSKPPSCIAATSFTDSRCRALRMHMDLPTVTPPASSHTAMFWKGVLTGP